VCLINELEGLVLGENSLFPWTCLSRHICVMMTICNYMDFFNLKDFKVLLDERNVVGLLFGFLGYLSYRPKYYEGISLLDIH
jgi:hypothetical protein